MLQPETSFVQYRRNILPGNVLYDFSQLPCLSLIELMRRTITISVSEEMHDLVYQGMHAHYYSTVSEYVRFLVRRDQRPDAVTEKKVVHPPVRTVNQCIEDALREIEAEKLDI